MTRIQQNMAMGGYLLGASLGVIRLAGARTFKDLLLVAAFTAAECSVVWLLERKARALDIEAAAWHEEEKARGQLESQVRAAAEEHVRRQRLLDESVEEIAEIQRDCELDHLMGDLKALSSIAVKAVRGGYQTGTLRNAGELGGVRYTAQDKEEA